MDLRVEKTRRGIINAFLALRARKPLEKITVKELCQQALINKSTFYTHYADLYALSDELETEAVASVMGCIAHPEYVLERPAQFTQELFLAYHAQNALIQTLFSDSRSEGLVHKIEQGLKELVFERRPAYRDDPVKNIILTYVIYGGYYAFSCNGRYDREQVVGVLGRISERIKGLMEETAPMEGG